MLISQENKISKGGFLLLKVVATCFLLTTLTHASNLFVEAKELYKKQLYEEAREKILEYLKISPNNLDANQFLVEIHFQTQNYSAADLVLQKLLKMSKSEKTRLLLAKLYFFKDDFKSSEKEIQNILNQNKRSVEAWLLLAKIKEKMGYIVQSHSLYKEIGILEPNNIDWLNQYGEFLLQQVPSGFPNHMALYQKQYPETFGYFYLYSRYHYKNGDFATSLSSVQRALYYNPNNRDGLELLFHILVAKKEYQGALNVLKKNLTDSNRFHYWLAILYYEMANAKGFLLPDKLYLDKNILQNLRLSILKNEDNESATIFSDFLIYNNFQSSDPIRKRCAEENFLKAKQWQTEGNLPLFETTLRWAVRLNPVEPNYRNLLASHYKVQNKMYSYYEELKIIKSFLKEPDFVLNTRIEILDKEWNNSLVGQYKLSPLSIDNIGQNISQITVTSPYKNTPNLQEIYKKQFEYEISTSSILTQSKTASAKIPSWLLHLDVQQYEKNLQVNVKVLDSIKKETIYEFRRVTTGNTQIKKSCFDIKRLLENNAPIHASIVKIQNHKILISAGFQQGVKVGSMFKFLDNPKDTIIVSRVEETVSEGALSNIANHNFIKPNQILILSKK